MPSNASNFQCPAPKKTTPPLPPHSVPEFIPTPKDGTPRKLSPNPPPGHHPRLLFSEADRSDLVHRALGEDSVIGKQAFEKLRTQVNERVYGAYQDTPVRRLLEVLACGETAPGAPGPRNPGTDQSAKDVFDAVCALVTDPDDPSRVLRSPFYKQLFEKNLAPSDLSTAMGTMNGYGRIVHPGEDDTTPELGAKFLFCSSEGGLPSSISTVYLNVKEAAYVAWILDEKDRLAWLGKVLSMACRVQLRWYAVPGEQLTKLCGGPPGYNKEDDSICQHLALAYDILHSSMSLHQSISPRRLLLTMGKRRTMTAFDAGPFSRGGLPGLCHLYTNGTFGMMTSLVVLVQCVVEGERVEGESDEEGREYPALEHDSEAQEYNSEGIKFWLTYGTAWDPSGTSRECPGYFGTTMRFASFPTLAVARRGHSIEASTNFYAVLSEIVQTSVTWFDATLCIGAHDGTGYCGGFGQSEYFLVVKYLFPDDPMVQYVYQKINTNWRGQICCCGIDKMPFQTALFGMNTLPTPVSLGDLAKEASLPLSFFSNARGMGTARSHWEDPNLALLYFECRPDMYKLGHGHSNRNDFYFSSHNRLWISGGQYHNTEPEAHSGVLIDGVGQGGCHTSEAERLGEGYGKFWSHIPGKVVETLDSPRITWYAGDAKAAYDYVSDGPQGPSEKPGEKMPVRTEYKWKDFFLCPPDFGPTFILEKKSMRPTWVLDHAWAEWNVCAKAEYNPVEYAFRTACLVRGKNSYVLIVDDIKKKGGGMHKYTWVANTTLPFAAWGFSKPIAMVDPDSMNLDARVEAVFVRGEDVDANTGKPMARCPLMLLRVLHSMGDSPSPIRVVYVDKGFPQKLDCASAYDYHRIEFDRENCRDPAFKVLLFPFVEGDPLPTTSYNLGSNEAVIECGGTRDVIAFTKEGDRTRVAVR